MAKYVVDAGHGGNEAQGRSTAYGVVGPNGRLEKDVTLELGRRVRERLGLDTILTRDGDYNLLIADRLAFAAQHQPAAFISIHANGGGAMPRGPETWTHSQASAESNELARIVHGELVRFGGRDRGLHAGDLAVLMPSRLPQRTASCLLEVDALSDPEGERALSDPRALDQLAGAIASGLRAYGDVRRPRRCLERSIVVPSTFAALEAEVREWIATCVASREGNLHRERELVNGNASLRAIWDSVSAATGETMRVKAEYEWRDGGTRSIHFSIPTIDFSDEPDDVPVDVPVLPPIDVFRRARQIIEDRKSRNETRYDGVPLEYLLCLAKAGERSDHQVIWGQMLLSNLDHLIAGRKSANDLYSSWRYNFRFIRATDPDEKLLDALVRNGHSADQALQYIIRAKGQGQSTVSPRIVELGQLLSARMHDPHDIYSCFNLGP